MKSIFPILCLWLFIPVLSKAQNNPIFFADTAGHIKCLNCVPGDTGSVNGIVYEAVDRNLLNQRRDQGADLTKLCTSLVTDMSLLFYGNQSFNQDISNWDVSHVNNMSAMFRASTYNQSIENWDVSQVSDMSLMFYDNAQFNQPIGSWDVSHVTTMSGMFCNASNFNQPISNWNVSAVTDMNTMFRASGFHQPIGNWNVSSVTNMSLMFYENHQFNQSIGYWDVSHVTNMEAMFWNASSFNQAINSWCVTQIPSAPNGFSSNCPLVSGFKPIWGTCTNQAPAQLLFFADTAGHIKCINCIPGDTGTVNGVVYEAVDRNLLNQRRDQGADLTKLCTSLVKDMSNLFNGNQTFNQDISNWDVSSVTNMANMFFGDYAFNQPIGSWEVDSVTNMAGLFADCHFNQPIGNWHVSSVTNMGAMFSQNTFFNQDISTWDVSAVTNMDVMFFRAYAFNQPIGNWNVHSVTSMSGMFVETFQFDQPLNSWIVGNVTNMNDMFFGSVFNQPIGNWDVSKVTNMYRMFLGDTNFNQPIGNWNVGQVTNMWQMFYGANKFNQNISGWDVHNVVEMSGMFGNTTFNQPIGNWNVGSVTNMDGMFAFNHAFNQSLNNWNVSSVTNMSMMFRDAYSFNQPIGNLNVGSVTNMVGMFQGANSFNQAIGNWDVSHVTDMALMFEGSSFNQPIANWNTASLKKMDVMFRYTPFNQPIGNWDVSQVTDMVAVFSYSPFNQPINNWNVSHVTNMSEMFRGNTVFNQSIGNWNMSHVSNMENMFYQANNFNQPIGNWDVSHVTNMGGMFCGAVNFNQNIDNWNVSHVINMGAMFMGNGNSSFNQPLGHWNVSSVTNFTWMFDGAAAFNQPINTWCVALIPSAPINFSSSSPLQTAYLPQWGTCPTVTPFADTAICLGNSAVIWAPAAPAYLGSPLHYTWSTGDTTLTLAVTPQQTTNYVCTISDGIQSYSDTIQIRVDTIAQNFITIDTLFSCAAQVSIEAPTGYDSYHWNSGETTAFIQPHGAGWYSCTVTHGACTAADVVLYQDAGIRQNDTSICLQESITLSHSSFESIPKTSLLAFWPLHGNAIDMVQNNNGVIHGAQVTNGRFGESGTALSFNGIDNYIQTPLQGSFSEITFSFWSFFDDSTLNMSSRNESVFGDWNNNNIHFGSRWSVGLHWNVNSAWTGITPSSLHYGWNHYVLVWNSLQNKKEVFINNVKVSTESANGNLQFGDFRIGVATNLNAYYRGKLSDFGVWSRALDTTEITQLYTGNNPASNLSLFTWNTNDTTSSITISPTQTTTYYCTVNNGANTCTDSVTVTVNPLPQNPISQDSISVLASQVTITPQQGYAQYHWNTGDSSTTLTVNQSGMYSLTVMNQYGCTVTDSVYVNIDPNFFEDSLGHIKCIYCVAGDTGTVNGILYEAVDRTLLNQRRDQGADLTKLCTTLVTDMSSLFSGNNTFNQDISHWDVSHVTTMQGMFSGANSFNQAIGTWDVGLVTDMRWMFYNDTSFNQAIGNWNVSSVTNMSGMFGFANNFNQPIGNWDVSHVTDMSWMFANVWWWSVPMEFNQDISNWNVSSVTNMEGMFENATSFNQPLGNWNVSHVTNMARLFHRCLSFNQPIGNWDVSHVTHMSQTLGRSGFNQPIGNWNVGSVIDMSEMFIDCPFNQPIGNWDVSHVINMGGMFAGNQQFNQPIGNWNVSHVNYMSGMFSSCANFNQPIGNWNVHNVVNMDNLFRSAVSFNQPIENWDVSNVASMFGMFAADYSFHQNIGNWNVSHVLNMSWMFRDAISFNKPIGNWNVQNVKYMEDMFNGATSFNQPINAWCVYQIPTVPYQFAVNCPNPVSQQPHWGTCPSLSLTNTLFSTDSMRVCGAEVYVQAPTGYSYLWNNQDTTQGIHATQSGWYVCTITDNASVSITDSVYIDLIHADIWVSNDTLLSCDSLQVAVALSTLNSNCTYAWNTGQNTANWQVSAMASQTLQVQVSNATHTCIDSTQITVLPRPLPLIAQDTLTACADSVLITAAAGYAHYQWNTGDTTQNIYAKYSGMYNLSVTHADGCMGTDTVLVSLIDDRIQQNDTAVCYGSNILVSVRGLFPSQHIAKTAEYVSNLYYDYDDFEGGLGSSDDWTERNGIDPQIVSNTAFSGSHSLYFNNGWGRNFEFGTAESAQPNGGYYSADYPYMSMAYKIPSTSHTTMLVHISGIGWRGIAFTQGEQLNCYPRIASWNATDTVITNNQWHFKTINLHEQLQQSLGAGNYKIEAVIFHDGCAIYPVSGEMWIDQFMITKQRPSLYPVSYAWNTNDTTSSISVTPTQTTTYYCTVNNGISSCTDSVTVTVNPLPTNFFTQDTLKICNTSSSLTAPANGSYSWSNVSTAQSITVNNTGWYACMFTNSNGCTSNDSVFVQLSSPSSAFNSVTACSSYTWPTNSQSYTQSGTYTRTSLNASGCTHTDTLQLNIQVCQTELHLGCLLDGYYDGNAGMVPVLQNQGEATTAGACDTIHVELHSDTAPYLLETSTNTVLQQNGTAICIFPYQTGSKYIVVKHRNAIETWSAQPINMGAVVNYDFRTSASKAYANNQVDVSGNGTIWALFTGDINQDQNVDLLDMPILEEDIALYMYGYTATDLNGDGNTDLLDVIYLDYGIANYVFSYHP